MSFRFARQSIAGLIFLNLLSAGAHAKSFETFGATFPVAEMSFLTLIESRLQALNSDDTLKALENQWVAMVSAHANRPKSVGLQRARQHHHHLYWPTITLSHDIVDSKHEVLFKKGTTVNALERMPSYAPHWIFFNSSDEAQVRWASKKLEGDNSVKVILTNGSISKTEEALKAPIYFDQAGRISNQLDIHEVPAEVVRAGNALRVSEVLIGESGYEG